MSAKRKRFNKQLEKRVAGQCLFCGEPDIDLLDVHRITPGSSYCERGTVVACSLCHRKIHSGRIVIEGKYFSTAGKWTVFYTEDGRSKHT